MATQGLVSVIGAVLMKRLQARGLDQVTGAKISNAFTALAFYIQSTASSASAMWWQLVLQASQAHITTPLPFSQNDATIWI